MQPSLTVQRMKFGVLVDRPVDAHQQSLGIQIGEMFLEIQPRLAAYPVRTLIQYQGEKA